MSKGFVFVYGTLRQSKKPSHYIRGYQMYDAGPYPYVAETGDPDHQVFGELLLVENDEMWAKLDKYEGVDRGLYYKGKAEVIPLEAGDFSVEAVVYTATSQWPTLIPEGEWRK